MTKLSDTQRRDMKENPEKVKLSLERRQREADKCAKLQAELEVLRGPIKNTVTKAQYRESKVWE